MGVGVRVGGSCCCVMEWDGMGSGMRRQGRRIAMKSCRSKLLAPWENC